ncbi:methylated-DNA--[protein]-cysteine S-methyltransferase [Bacillus sp. REN10]|uniref:methylated-DNA--[protein]-cysteine S-methyltransferase n=1 Tax=Bacillus sp. REN10 TaxID=2782541 RepID=UPI00193C5E6C|nr:methylated-DNA--[protein]-cysteine S-methyltransferase [Bacillus sp. REN10]
MKRLFIHMLSPIGPLSIVRNEKGICSIQFSLLQEEEDRVFQPDDVLLKEAVRQLGEYFEQNRTDFDLPIDITGTDFQQAVWNALRHIPIGETRSYSEIAERIGNKKAVRAVGQANKANPVPIVIPCHRVIGKNQSLTGYAGKEIDKKRKLLKLEGVL